MPDRVIRDDILDSERYLSLSSDTARLCFLHLILVADDLGNCDGSNLFLRRRVLVCNLSEAAVTKIISELADTDLIRLYEHEGKRLIHIPRFRQRIRYIKRAHPRPPEGIECNEIKDLISKKSDYSQSIDGLQSDEVKRSEEKRREVKGSNTSPTRSDQGQNLLRDSTTEKPKTAFDLAKQLAAKAKA